MKEKGEEERKKEEKRVEKGEGEQGKLFQSWPGNEKQNVEGELLELRRVTAGFDRRSL